MIDFKEEMKTLKLNLPSWMRLKGALFVDKTSPKGWKPTATKLPLAGLDPTVIGYDGRLHPGVASMQYQTSAAAYTASGTPSIVLPRNTFITEIMLVADPYQTQGDGTSIPTIVEDAMDKLLQGLSVSGGPTYYQHSDAITFAKALGNLNKYVYGGAMERDDISTLTAATNHNNVESWRLHFGALNDYQPFDISAGIPAEDETALNLAIQYSANNLQANVTSFNILQTGTNVYAVVIGVNGMDANYRANVPIPDFRTDIIASPTTTTTFNLLGSRFLKRTTIISQATASSNNNARNDSNLTDLSIVVLKPTSIRLLDRARILVAKSLLSSWGARWPGISYDGSAIVELAGLVGVYVIDWRKITGNPYGLDLYNMQTGDVQVVFTVGTTTGQLSALNEYYAARNAQTLAAMRAWQGMYAFQPV